MQIVFFAHQPTTAAHARTAQNMGKQRINVAKHVTGTALHKVIKNAHPKHKRQP